MENITFKTYLGVLTLGNIFKTTNNEFKLLKSTLKKNQKIKIVVCLKKELFKKKIKNEEIKYYFVLALKDKRTLFKTGL
jgi:hypothetical protein